MTRREMINAIDGHILALQSATTPQRRAMLWQSIKKLRAELDQKNKTMRES